MIYEFLQVFCIETAVGEPLLRCLPSPLSLVGTRDRTHRSVIPPHMESHTVPQLVELCGPDAGGQVFPNLEEPNGL